MCLVDTRDPITTATRTPTAIGTWVTGTHTPTAIGTWVTGTRTPTAIGTRVTGTRTPTAISTRDSITTAMRVHMVTDPRPFIITTRQVATDTPPIVVF